MMNITALYFQLYSIPNITKAPGCCKIQNLLHFILVSILIDDKPLLKTFLLPIQMSFNFE